MFVQSLPPGYTHRIVHVCMHDIVHVCTGIQRVTSVLLQEEDLYQEAEPLVTGGIAAALQLASKKGFISSEKPKREAGESMRTTTDAKRDL